MAVGYIGDNVSIDASRWNTLFAELDRKLSDCFDSKSPLCLGPLPESLCGKVFSFAPNEESRKFSLWAGNTAYDHSVFETGLADFDLETEVGVWDAEKHIAILKRDVDAAFRTAAGVAADQRFFDQSLQAHYVLIEDVPHYVLELQMREPYHRPEARYKYAQADLILEGGVTSLTWPTWWDKYSFFRVHNMNNSAATITFPEGFVLTIPRWGCKCVRRKDGVYTAGWNYLQRMLPGDPRLLEMPNNRNTPYGSMGSNNVCSIVACHHWITGVTVVGGWELQHKVKALADVELLHDISSLYAQQFPIQTNDTPIGDLLHHKGELIDVRTDGGGVKTERIITFNGYDSLVETMAENDIVATANPDGTFTLTSDDEEAVKHDIWSKSTNLLSYPDGFLGYQVLAGADLKVGFTTTNNSAGVAGSSVSPVLQNTYSQSFDYSTLGTVTGDTVDLDDIVSVAIPNESSDAGDAAGDIDGFQMKDWTVSYIKSLEPWKDESYGSEPLNNDRSAYSNVNLKLTESGLWLTWKHAINLEYRIQYSTLVTNGPDVELEDSDAIDATVDHGIRSFTASGLELVRYRHFGEWGWPTGSFPAFLDPRLGWRFIAEPDVSTVSIWDDIEDEKVTFTDDPVFHHPNITNELEPQDGEDWGIDHEIDEEEEVYDIGILMPVQNTLWADGPLLGGKPYAFPMYPCPDPIPEFLLDRSVGYTFYSSLRATWLANTQVVENRAVRINLTREHYNHLASRVNQMTKCVPLHFEHFLAIGYDSLGDGPVPAPNTLGPFGGSYYPATMYCSFAEDSLEHQMFVALGVPIKTEADLPSDLAAVKATKPKHIKLKTVYTKTWDHVSREDFGIPPDQVLDTYDVEWELGTTTIDSIEEQEAGTIYDVSIFDGNPEIPEDFFWVTIDDVKAAAELYGFKFLFERLAVPYKLQIFEIDSIQVLHQSVTSETYEEQLVRDKLFNEATLEYDIPPPLDPADGFEEELEEEWFSFPPFVSNVAKMVHVTNQASSPTWLRDRRQRNRFVDYRAGDVATAKKTILGPGGPAFTTVVVKLNYGPEQDQYLRQVYTRHPENEALPLMLKTPSLFHQSYVSGSGLNRRRKILFHTVQDVKHSTTQFSAELYKNAIGVLQHGIGVVPLELVEGFVTEGPMIIEITAEILMIIAPTDGYSYEPIYFIDWPMSL